MKRALNIIFIVIFVICLHLSVRFLLNELYIKKYNNGDYSNSIINYLLLLNFPDDYVAYYNKGNNYYNLAQYSDAVEEYDKALRTVKGERRCKVVTNKGLALYYQVDFKSRDARTKLEHILQVLLDSDCATVDYKGTFEPAQTLYNIIEAMLKGSGGGDPIPGDDPPDDGGGGGTPIDYTEIERKLREQKKDATDERKDVKRKEYEYYKGESW